MMQVGRDRVRGGAGVHHDVVYAPCRWACGVVGWGGGVVCRARGGVFSQAGAITPLMCADSIISALTPAMTKMDTA